MNKIKIPDKIALLADKPENALSKGKVGVVIEIGRNDVRQILQDAIEFTGKDKREFGGRVFTAEPSEILPLNFDIGTA